MKWNTLNKERDGQSQYKQAIVIRSNLKMSPGKTAVQASHAAVSASERARKLNSSWWSNWIEQGQRKIALKVESEGELLELERKSLRLHVPTVLIADMGLTELPLGTVTALGIGPAPSSLVDKLTGNLPLY